MITAAQQWQSGLLPPPRGTAAAPRRFHLHPAAANPVRRHRLPHGPLPLPAAAPRWGGVRVRASGGKGGEDLSDFKGTSGPVKALVGGLTALINAGRPQAEPSDPALRGPPVEPPTLRAGIEEDFTENGYLWTGEITDNLYDEECRFTDPTLSFKGLTTFKTNLQNLQPVLNRLVRDRDIELFSCELDEASTQVTAKWRMMGEFALPWSPVLELTGQTVFTYDESRGGRVVSYDESWGITAADALMQLARPGGDRRRARR